MNARIKDRPLDVSPTAQAQAEIFWLAFQALSPEAQWAVREQLTQWEAPAPELAAELESWQAAASEALATFEAALDDQAQ